MLVITPTYTTCLPQNKGIVLVIDHQPLSHINSIEADLETGSIYYDQSYNSIEQIIKDNNIDVEHVYMNHYLEYTDFPYPHTCVPHRAFFAECIDFLEHSNTTEYSDKQNCFVMMNKLRENRLLVSAWFKQNKNIDFDYTQGWEITDNDFSKVQEYTRLTNYSFDDFLTKKFIPYKNQKAQIYYRNIGLGNASMWNDVFKEKFCSSTFAIITEPVFWEKACSITEKYLMSIYGCCFPIFCGGYKLPEKLTSIGFDVFNDVVDHSYQYELHPALRVCNALEHNRKLLENSNVKKLDFMDRHFKNLSLVRDNLDKFISQFDDISNFQLPDNIRKW